MDVTDIFSASRIDATANAAGVSDASNTIDQEDFLTLLVAQLQNQDPLNPMESAEFSSQLAQFSSLEQLMQINQGIEALGASNGSAPLDALGLLGREVSARSGEVDVVDGEASALSFELAAAGTVDVEISAGGVSLGTFALGDLGVGTHSLSLADLDGLPPLSDGTYTFTVRSSTTPDPVPTFVAGQVTGVDLSGTSPVLVLGSRRIELSEVREVRTAAGTTPTTTTPEDEGDSGAGDESATGPAGA